MNYEKTKDGIIIHGVTDLDLSQTLFCGQCFRWSEKGGGFYGAAAYGKYAEVKSDGESLTIRGASLSEAETLWTDYFDLKTDYGKIREAVSAIHPALAEAAAFAPGIKILRQEPFEALCSFVISQNNNIKRIRGIVERLCAGFGDKPDCGEYTFPSAEKIAGLSESDLAELRAGFRTRYIIDAARKTASGEVDLEACRTLPLDEARAQLMKITGVGAKVADCTLLFGMHRLEAFPVDVWMKRALGGFFGGMSASDFGEYAGVAQQYIFHYSRMHPELFETGKKK